MAQDYKNRISNRKEILVNKSFIKLKILFFGTLLPFLKIVRYIINENVKCIYIYITLIKYVFCALL